MRFTFSLSRQQAAVALIVGRRFASAFVAAPRGAALFGSTDFPMAPPRTSLAGNNRRWLHAVPTDRQVNHSARLGVFPTTATSFLVARRSPSPRPCSGRPLMMSSTTDAVSGEEICRAAHVLCADEEAAEAALDRIKAGEQFGDVAAEMSSCPSKDKGGDLGWFKKGQMVAEFEAACFENDPGTIVKVQTQFGWHVVALLSRAIMPRQMSVEELGEVLELLKSGAGDAKNKYQFVDVREEEELAKAKLDGFVNLPLSKFEEWGGKLSGEGAILDAEKDTVVMCHHGMRSNQMAQHLATKAGFKKVWNVEGGLHAYATFNKAMGAFRSRKTSAVIVAASVLVYQTTSVRASQHLRHRNLQTYDEGSTTTRQYKYLGCFQDRKGDRVLGHKLTEDKNVTADFCYDYCVEKGAPLMATQFSIECWCAEEVEVDFGRHGRAECNFPCAGNADEVCGGYTAFSLYQIIVNSVEPGEGSIPKPTPASTPEPTPEPNPSPPSERKDTPGALEDDIVKIISVVGANPKDNWHDSYSAGGRCYMDTTFDHKIGDVEVETPLGMMKVKDLYDKLEKGPGPDGNPLYNDIQCGNGPPNNAADETECPGLVDHGPEGCGQIGPMWDLSELEP
eukprot:g17302.t1